MAQATVLVASPSAIGSTPVASGSSVPPCPAFAASRQRRTCPTARLELIPKGLSRTSQPWIGRPCRLAVIVGRVLLRTEIALHLRSVQQFADAAGMVEGGIE